ncbi:MAG: protein kinase [Cyanobacteriota bacterium]|nr:protein kinase [Cyanobacteriota bacterium]
MTFCLNPDCRQPNNPDDATSCRRCGSTLLLRGRYRPLQALGQGGFGRTYLALDRDRLETRCVIKQLLPHQLVGSNLDRATLDKMMSLFRHEAMQLSKLGEHPQIPTLFAFFEENGLLYLVQEYIDGQTLWHELRDNGAFSEQQIRQVLIQLLPVLRFIHKRGVIHRDITPVNILRRKRDGKLILIDFGVAKQLTRTSLARPGTKVGTAGYAPLEQLRSGKAYPASDIYSLGVTCIHLLTQTRPDLLYDPVRGWQWREKMAQQQTSISDRIAKILDKTIADMIRERYQSADEVIRDLKATLRATARANARHSAPPPPPPRSTPGVSSTRTSRAPQPVTSATRTTTPPQPTSPLPPSVLDALPNSKIEIQRPGWNPIYTLGGHDSWVTCTAICPDGKQFATGSLDKTVRIWNLETGEEIRKIEGHRSTINALSISRDSTSLASASDDDTVKIWNLETGKLLETLNEHLRDVTSVAFSADSKTLISGSEDRTVKIWNVTDGELVTSLMGGSGMVKSIAIGTSGQILASGGLDNNIYLWNLSTHKTIATLLGHFNSVLSLAISPDGTLLASGSKDRTLRLWKLPHGELMRTLSGHLANVNSVVFHPDGDTIVTGSSDKRIKFWQIKTGECTRTLSGHLGAVTGVAIAPDGKNIVSTSSDKTIKVWRWFD